MAIRGSSPILFPMLMGQNSFLVLARSQDRCDKSHETTVYLFFWNERRLTSMIRPICYHDHSFPKLKLHTSRCHGMWMRVVKMTLGFLTLYAPDRDESYDNCFLLPQGVSKIYAIIRSMGLRELRIELLLSITSYMLMFDMFFFLPQFKKLNGFQVLVI